MISPAPVRVIAFAVVISALSFAVGVAGDLSAPPPKAGARVVVSIPPTSGTLARAPRLLATPVAAGATIRASRVVRSRPLLQQAALRAEGLVAASAPAPKQEQAWARPPEPKPFLAELAKQEFVKV